MVATKKPKRSSKEIQKLAIRGLKLLEKGGISGVKAAEKVGISYNSLVAYKKKFAEDGTEFGHTKRPHNKRIKVTDLTTLTPTAVDFAPTRGVRVIAFEMDERTLLDWMAAR